MIEKIKDIISLSEKMASQVEEKDSNFSNLSNNPKKDAAEELEELKKYAEGVEKISNILEQMTDQEFKTFLALMLTGRYIYSSKEHINQEEAQKILNEYTSQDKYPVWEKNQGIITYIVEKSLLHSYLKTALKYFEKSLE